MVGARPAERSYTIDMCLDAVRGALCGAYSGWCCGDRVVAACLRCDAARVQLVEAEELDCDNMWTCPQCKVPVAALKQLTLYRLPSVLFLHLKRFQYRCAQPRAGSCARAREGLRNVLDALLLLLLLLLRRSSDAYRREKLSDFVSFPVRGLDLST